ncbi:hypothetical protein [Anaerobium acetethylicum]
MFYQYSSYGYDWGAMHWDHAISEDMKNWRNMPIALFPNQWNDNHGEGR